MPNARNDRHDGPSIVWFRQDLRLADHTALRDAIAAGGVVLPLYIWSPEEEGGWPPGAAARWWLHQSLCALDADLRARGAALIVRRGPVNPTLRAFVRETGATRIFFHRRYEPAARAQEAAVQREFPADGAGDGGAAAFASTGSLLFEPEDLRTRAGGPFQVFTPFWRACLARPRPPDPLAAPRALHFPAAPPASCEIRELALEPAFDWAGGLRETWTPGEAGARRALARFLEGAMSDYAEGRNLPGRPGTSRLSPHLHHGEISPRQVWHAVQDRVDPARPGRSGVKPPAPTRAPVGGSGAEFLRELGWRDFAHHLLVHFPHTVTEPMRSEFVRFPWAEDPAGFAAWRRGRTGYPFVDAGLRELWTTGWMHNRVRMVVASFLVKDLLLPWQDGARWFWDTLVDADLANNTLGWQWTAGCGADAAPYFRVFNPNGQGEKFDADGGYARRWVPELASLPTEWIHRPHEAPVAVLARARVTLGADYPHPLVDHSIARGRALDAIARLRGRP